MRAAEETLRSIADPATARKVTERWREYFPAGGVEMGDSDRAHLLDADASGPLEALIAEVLAFKRRNRGVITNSDYYLEQVPRYARGEIGEPCRSGVRTIHLNPSGYVKRCPDFPTDFHWRDFRRYEPVSCNACYYACRGEAQAPLRLSQVADVLA